MAKVDLTERNQKIKQGRIGIKQPMSLAGKLGHIGRHYNQSIYVEHHWIPEKIRDTTETHTVTRGEHIKYHGYIREIAIEVLKVLCGSISDKELTILFKNYQITRFEGNDGVEELAQFLHRLGLQ